MRDTIKKPFNKRAFIVLTAASAGLGLPITGLANHLLQMEPMGLMRHAWMAAHTCLGIICSVFVIWHILLNRRALFNHLRGASSHMSGMSREVFWSVTFVAAVLCIAVGHTFL